MLRCRKSGQAIVPGLVFLAVANVGCYLLRRSGSLPENVVDGISGLLNRHRIAAGRDRVRDAPVVVRTGLELPGQFAR